MTKSQLAIICLLATLLFRCSSFWASDSSSGNFSVVCSSNCYQWKPLKIGAGGFISGIDVSPNNETLIIRTDTYGAYRWESGRWVQLVTAASMPANDVGADGTNQGVYEIRVAPSEPDRLYMSYFGSVYISRNRGLTWIKTALTSVNMSPSDVHRTLGQKMAVDPHNPDIVFVGTSDGGMHVSRDGGTSFNAVSGVPTSAIDNGSYPGITGIVFDSHSAVVGGATQRVYASSYGNGIYRSQDGGVTWQAMAGGPTSVTNAALGADGTYWALSNGSFGTNTLWSLSGGVFTNPATPGGGQHWVSVSPDPFNPDRVVLGSSGGYLSQSQDRGSTWDGILWSVNRSAIDIPWLQWTKEDYMTNANVIFDPVEPNKLWFAQGIGVWTTTMTPSAVATAWTSQSEGIEQLVANAIAVPPGGAPVLASWDRPFFRITNPDAYPTVHGPNRLNSIVMGFAIDYAAGTPTFLAGIADYWGVEESGFSADGGVTWTKFSSFPSGWSGNAGMGTIAVSTPQNFVWVPSESKTPYYTLDQGATWTKVDLPGNIEANGDYGWLHPAHALNRHVVAADRVNTGTFYIYHARDGVFRSIDGGVSWTLVTSSTLVPAATYNAKLRSVPFQAGHLFFTKGHESGNTPGGAFMRSRDGGVNWTAVPNVLEVHAFGFGKSAPGQSYPAVFIAGWVNGVYGIYRSDDDCSTWVKTGDYPLGSLDQVKAIEGDFSTFGKVYIGFAGSGYAYGVSP